MCIWKKTKASRDVFGIIRLNTSRRCSISLHLQMYNGAIGRGIYLLSSYDFVYSNTLSIDRTMILCPTMAMHGITQIYLKTAWSRWALTACFLTRFHLQQVRCCLDSGASSSTHGSHSPPSRHHGRSLHHDMQTTRALDT